MSSDRDYYELDPEHTDPARLKRERAKAKELRQSSWWKQKIGQGLCHYCGRKFAPKELTMDHVVPLARGGRSTKNNLVPACAECNQAKKLGTPAEELLKKLGSDSGF